MARNDWQPPVTSRILVDVLTAFSRCSIRSPNQICDILCMGQTTCRRVIGKKETNVAYWPNSEYWYAKRDHYECSESYKRLYSLDPQKCSTFEEYLSDVFTGLINYHYRNTPKEQRSILVKTQLEVIVTRYETIDGKKFLTCINSLTELDGIIQCLMLLIHPSTVHLFLN